MCLFVMSVAKLMDAFSSGSVWGFKSIKTKAAAYFFETYSIHGIFYEDSVDKTGKHDLKVK